MVNVRRVNHRDVHTAGNLENLIAKLVDQVRTGNMEVKERGAMYLRSLTEQPKGIGGGKQSEENAVLIARAGAVKPLISLVIIGSPKAQTHACAAIAHIANERQQYQEAILEAGGVLPIASALRAGDSALQEQAAAALASISQLEDSRKSIMKVGSIPALVNLLKNASAETQIHVSAVLGNLAQGNNDGIQHLIAARGALPNCSNPEAQHAIARVGALPLLIELLGSGKTQEAVAHCIAHLTKHCDASQMEVFRLGGIPKLVAQLNIVNPSAQAAAAHALAALASHKRNDEKDTIARAGGLRALLALIDSRHTATQEQAIHALAMLACNHKDNQDSIASMGGIMPLIGITQSMGAYTAGVQAETVLALAEIARHNFANQSTITESDGIGSLVNLLRHSNSPVVEAEVAGALWSLSEDHGENKVRIAGAGAIPALMLQLASQKERAQVHATHAIASIAFGNEANQAEATSLLVGLLEDPDVGTQSRAAEALWRIVQENPSTKRVIAKAGGPEPLVRLLHSSLPRAKSYALWSLSLAIDEDNQKVVAKAGGIKPLVKLLNAPDYHVNEQAACAIQLLAQKNKETQVAIATQGAIEPLIALLDADGTERLQEFAAAALSDLAMIPANKAAIDRGGGIQPLVALLSDSHRQLHSKKYAAAALARLSADEEERKERMDMMEHKERLQREKRRKGLALQGATEHDDEITVARTTKAESIADAGAILPLVELLRGERGLEAQEEAAGALWALAENSRNRKSITEFGGIGPLVELLGSPNTRAREHAEQALVRLSIENANRVLIIRQLVGMLQESSGTAAQEQAAAALSNLARESTDNRVSILEAGGIPRLLALTQSASTKAKENAVSAISQLAYKNIANQNAITEAKGIPMIVSTLQAASVNAKEMSLVYMCTLCAAAIWNLADKNQNNQRLLMKEGAIPAIIAMITNPSPDMQTNAAGALAALALDNADNQGAIVRSGAAAPLCTMVRDGTPETREEAAAALWSLSNDNAPNQATIAKLGGIEPLVSMLMSGTSEKSSINAAGALAALAKQHSENCSTITKRMATAIERQQPQARAVRLLNAIATLCDNESMNQIAMSKIGGVQPLIPWLNDPNEDVQIQAARALLAVSSNNATTQALIGNLGGVKPLVQLVERSNLEAQEHAACALWHLASLAVNRNRIAHAKGIVPLVGMLIAEGERAAQIAAMTLLRLAEGSTKAANTIAQAGSLLPFVKLLTSGNIGTQQMAAATLAAIAAVPRNRDAIANAGAIKPLINLLTSTTLGTPETAARALGFLARADEDVDQIDGCCDDEGVSYVENDPSASEEPLDVDIDVARAKEAEAISAEAYKATDGTKREDYDSSDDEDDNAGQDKHGVEDRRILIKSEDGVSRLISMLDGSNLCGKDNVLKPPLVGGWAALRIGIEGCIESQAIFPGSLVDYGVRIGMQEQAASTLSDLAEGDLDLQDMILAEGGVAPLLSLVRSGTQHGQEFAARAIWFLSTAIDNQLQIVNGGAIPDLVQLLKNGSPTAQYMAAAALSELADGAIQTKQGDLGKKLTPEDPSQASHGEEYLTAMAEETSTSMHAATGSVIDDGAQSDEDSQTSNDDGGKKRGPSNRLLAINEAGGIVPVVKLCDNGTPQGKEKAAAAIWHLALDRENQSALAANGAIKPLVALLIDGTDQAKRFASLALTRLATGNSDNQAQIAKRLVGLLDHDDSNVVTLAANDLQSLAHDHPGAPMVIVNAGAISPLVSVLSNGKTDEGRQQAAKTLHTLANSGPANQIAIAIGLVALLGVGSDQAQEYVTELLLTLTSGGADADLESVATNRRAIANAGPFKMLVMQLRSTSVRVKMLASAVLAQLSGDTEDNVTEIGRNNGIAPLVALLSSDNTDDTQRNATIVLADMARISMEYAASIASEEGIPLLVSLLTNSKDLSTQAYAADTIASIAVEHALVVGAAGAIVPLVKLLSKEDVHARQMAAKALAAVAAGGQLNQDVVKQAGGVELLVSLLDPELAGHENVQSRSAGALAMLARDNPANQLAITECGGIEPLVALVTDSSHDQPKVHAARTLWSLSDKNHKNQVKIAEADGIKSLVTLVGCTSDTAVVSGAIASLALDNEENQATSATLLVQLLKDSSARDDSREKAARALAYFAKAHPSNQDAIAAVNGVPLLISLLSPKLYEARGTGTMLRAKSAETAVETNAQEVTGKHHLTQKELCSAVWSMANQNGPNQASIAAAGGIGLLISMLRDHPDIRRDAAGALWALSADPNNQKLVAEGGGIARLAELLKHGKNNYAQETAAGALHSLAARLENRALIADADGIPLLIPLFDGDSVEAKEEVTGALCMLAIENPANQFSIASKLVAMLSKSADESQDSGQNDKEGTASRLKAQEYATRVLHTMSKERDYREAISRTGVIHQLIRQLKGGTEMSQQMASSALSHVARMSGELRIRVTGELVDLLGDSDADVRQRAGIALRENTSDGGEDSKHQREAAMAGGVAPLVELLRSGLEDGRLEAQEYSLWSLSVTTEPTRRIQMVSEGSIPLLVKSLQVLELREESKEHAAMVIASLALDMEAHQQIMKHGTLTQLVQLLKNEQTTTNGKKQAALAMARLSYDGPETQAAIANEGAIAPLVQWLGDATIGPPDMAALALADIARGNVDLQNRIAEAGAIAPLVAMLSQASTFESHRAACIALANLARDNTDNMLSIAEMDGIAPLVALLKESRCQEAAANAVSTLAADPDIKLLFLRAGGVPPLVALLCVENPTTQRHTARAIEALARDCSEIQEALAGENAPDPLVNLLASDSIDTQESSVQALLCLATHGGSRHTVVTKLVEMLGQRNTGAQLKAAEALAALALRSSLNRSIIVQARAIEPLVALLGNGARSEQGTPPERAAAVLASLSCLSESKVEIGRVGGIGPLVMMLSSACDDARANAACALRHLSSTIDNKAMMTETVAIPNFVSLLDDINATAKQHAACALWQLCTTVESKTAIVDAGGIQLLVKMLRNMPSTDSAEEKAGESLRWLDAKEALAALLSELARCQGVNRDEIVRAGGVPYLVGLLGDISTTSPKYATCALWGISQIRKYRHVILEDTRAIGYLVELLRRHDGETQGFAVSTLVCLSNEKEGKLQIKAVGGAGPLMTIALGPQGWLRDRCVEVLKNLDYPDPTKEKDKTSGQSTQVLSPRFMKFQAQLAANPAIWMVPDDGSKHMINDEHMADLACKIKEGDRVLVDPGNRKAEVRYVGKIPEIGKGYWVGVQFDDPVGKNDGSIKGRRCFECTHDFGGFLRPNHIRIDPNPRSGKARRVKCGEELQVDALGSERTDGKKLRKTVIPTITNEKMSPASNSNPFLSSGVETGGDFETLRKFKSKKQQATTPRKTGTPGKATGSGLNTPRKASTPRKSKEKVARAITSPFGPVTVVATPVNTGCKS